MLLAVHHLFAFGLKLANQKNCSEMCMYDKGLTTSQAFIADDIILHDTNPIKQPRPYDYDNIHNNTCEVALPA